MNVRLAKRFWQLHSLCALYTGGFLAFALVTGAIAVFAAPLYDWEFRHLSRLDVPAALDPGVLPDAVARSQKLLAADGGSAEFSRAELPADSHRSVRLNFYVYSENENPFLLPAPWSSVSVFVHPQTGDILGFAEDGRSLAEFLATLHIRLFADTPGRNFVGMLGLSLFVLSLSGLLILSRFLGRKALWLIRRDTKRAANSDLHKLVGFLLVLPALLFAITGFWLGMQGRLMTWFDIDRPESFERSPVIEADEDATLVPDISAVLEAARQHHPELIPETIGWSADGQRSVRLYGRVEPMLYERQSHGVVLDKTDLSLLHLNDAANGSWQEKLFYLQEGLHFGEWGGMPVRWLYFAVGLLLAALPLTGFAVQLLRARRSLLPLATWSGVALGCSGLLLVAVKTLGYAAANAYGSLLLWTFVVLLAGRWIWLRLRRRPPKPAPQCGQTVESRS